MKDRYVVTVYCYNGEPFFSSVVPVKFIYTEILAARENASICLKAEHVFSATIQIEEAPE